MPLICHRGHPHSVHALFFTILDPPPPACARFSPTPIAFFKYTLFQIQTRNEKYQILLGEQRLSSKQAHCVITQSLHARNAKLCPLPSIDFMRLRHEAEAKGSIRNCLLLR